MELQALVQEELKELLDSRVARAAFATTRATAAEDLALSVKGVGPITFPVSKATVRKLRSVARPAKYGKGTATIEDRRVRDSWVVPKSRVKLDGRRWRKTLGPQLEAIHADLGLPAGTRLRARLHDLLVYEEGQFFLAHQDTEKTDTMVATLVVVLPSVFEGGESVITHGDATVVEAARSRSKLTFLAFYADCRHEVRPVTRGHRVALTYALELIGEPAPAPWSPEAQEALAELVEEHFATEVLVGWRGEQAVPDRWVYLLDHEYTPRTLSWRKLKGRDAEVAAALREAAEDGEHDIFLATAEVHEKWMCEPEQRGRWDGGWGGHYGDRRTVSEGEHPPLIELHDESVVLDHWIDGDGERTGEAASAVTRGELLWGMEHGELTPFELEHEGYMGNYGDTVDRWYHRAAIVLRPRSRAFIARAKHDPDYALETIGTRLDDNDRSGAVELAEQLLPYWPTLANRAPGAAVLRTAAGFDDGSLAKAFLAPLSLADASDPIGLRALAEAYGIDFLQTCVGGWRERGGYRCLSSDEQLPWLGALAELATGDPMDTDWVHAELERSVEWVRQALVATDSSQPPSWRGRAHRALVPALADLFQASVSMQAEDLVRPVREVLVQSPESELASRVAMLEAMQERLGKDGFAAASLPDLARKLVGAIEEQLARPERDPNDWSITTPWDCAGCDLCPELRAFLASPDEQALEWPLAKRHRQHIHRRLDSHELPVTHVTRRQGRPYTLVLRKTDELLANDRAERERLTEASRVAAALGAENHGRRKQRARKK